MESIKERAEELYLWDLHRDDEYMFPISMKNLCRQEIESYTRGAIDQCKIDIEKACKWLEKNIHEDLSMGTWEDNKQNIMADFCKAMIEE